MAVSDLINNNEEHIKDAINSGIAPDAVSSTLNDIISKSDEIGKTPSQAKKVVETIVEMKKDTPNKVDGQYSSEFVKENNEKIKSAINGGITSSEIAKTLIESTNKANDKKAKNHLKFLTKLISKMKIKELSLTRKKENQLEKGRQKVLNK